MKPLKATLLVLFCLSIQFFAQAQHPNSLARVKVKVPASPEQRLKLISLLQLDHFVEAHGYIDTEIGQRELAKLRQSQFSYTVEVNDCIADLRVKNAAYNEARANGLINMDGSPVGTPSTSRVAFEQPGKALASIIQVPSAFQVWGTFGGYYSYAQMVTAITNLYDTYSPLGIVDTFHIGTTVLGNIIYAIKISDNATTDETNEPEAFFQGVQHAREAIGGSSMIFMMQYLCQMYSTESRIKDLVDNREIYIIPCMNVDGWEYNRTNGGAGALWRKNRKSTGSGNYGVDLNRNWSTDWAQCAGAVGEESCGSGDKSEETYWGTGAFSEPETMAVRNFIRSKHIVVANDQHSVGPYYSLPYGRPGLHTADPLTTMQVNWFRAIPALMGKYNGMRAGNSVQALGYEVAGGVKDWFLKGDIGSFNGGVKTNILGMTGEGGYGTTGSSTFWPPSGAIVNLCRGMMYQNLQMIYSAGSYVDIQDNSDMNVTATSGSFSFKLKRLGIDNQNVTVQMIPLINVKGNGSTSVTVTPANLPNYYDSYTGSINYQLPSSITTGQRLRFVWRVTTQGYSYSDTITKIYNATTVFSDDFSGAIGDNWTNANEGTVASGYGYNYTGGDWVFTGGGVSGNALSESANGSNYSSQSIRILQKTANLNLSAITQAAYLTFMTRHAAENFHDKLQICVSINGATWDTLAGKTTVREPGTVEETSIDGRNSLTGIEPDWVKEEFNLSPYVGQPSLRLKFVFTSDDATTFYAAQDEGFFIDNLRVWGSSTPFVILASNFLSFNGKLLPDNTVELKWDATTDNDHRYFEVEKSSDRLNFTPIGQVSPNAQKRLIDPTPFIGNNFYRVKQVDVNGKETYSAVVNVVYSPKAEIVQLYPNPVKDELTVRLKLGAVDKVSIQTWDLAGRLVQQQDVNGTTSVREYKVDASKLAANIYVVKIVNSQNEVISVQKFVKQ